MCYAYNIIVIGLYTYEEAAAYIQAQFENLHNPILIHITLLL